MNLRFATPTTPLPPDVRDRISRAVREQADHALRIRGSDPSAASSDSPLPSEPARSSIPVPTSDASLPTTKILSLGLGFIGAALIAIVITLFLRYYLVTRDRRQAADGIPPRDGQGEGRRGFWGSFAEWWAGYWTGSGTEFWGPQYVVRRRSKRPEMWEVMLDEKALGSPGQDSRLSADAGTAKEGEKAAQRADVAAEAGVAEGSGRTESICKVGRAAEEAEELFGGLTQVSFLICHLRLTGSPSPCSPLGPHHHQEQRLARTRRPQPATRSLRSACYFSCLRRLPRASPTICPLSHSVRLTSLRKVPYPNWGMCDLARWVKRTTIRTNTSSTSCPCCRGIHSPTSIWRWSASSRRGHGGSGFDLEGRGGV